MVNAIFSSQVYPHFDFYPQVCQHFDFDRSKLMLLLPLN